MAKYGEGVNYAKSLAPSSENILDPGVFGGKLRIMNDYVSVTEMNSQDYVVVGTKLPTGSQIVEIRFTASTPALTTATATLVVGDQGSSSRYYGGLVVATATTGALFVGPQTPTGMLYTVTGVTDNYIRIGGAAANSVLSGATIKVSVGYIVE